MSANTRFDRVIEHAFDRLGCEAEFWPADGRSPFTIRVIARRPQSLLELGESSIHVDDPQLEFPVRDVPSPVRGDDIHMNDDIYRIESEPRFGQHQLVWVVDALRL